MDARRLGLLLSLLSFAAGGAQAATQVQLLETFPPGDDIVVAPNANVYLRASYTVDAPQHIWLRPYFQGKPARAGSGTSPVYSGSGELLGWFFFTEGAGEVDEIRVTAGDGSLAGTPLVASWPLHVRVRAGADNGSEPAWVARMIAERDAADRAAAAAYVDSPPTATQRALISGFAFAVPLLSLFGLLAPLWGLLRWRRGWRLAAAVPALVVWYVALGILIGGWRDPTSHNLWPFEMLIAGGFSSAVSVCCSHLAALAPARCDRSFSSTGAGAWRRTRRDSGARIRWRRARAGCRWRRIAGVMA